MTAQSERPVHGGPTHSDAPRRRPAGLAVRRAAACSRSSGSRYLLRLLVQKEIQARYQGSLLGLLWSYVQPLVQFFMYFFVIGLIFGLHKTVPNFAIHVFAALIVGALLHRDDERSAAYTR